MHIYNLMSNINAPKRIIIVTKPGNEAKKASDLRRVLCQENTELEGISVTLYDQVHTLLQDNFRALEERESGHWVEEDGGGGIGLGSMGVDLSRS